MIVGTAIGHGPGQQKAPQHQQHDGGPISLGNLGFGEHAKQWENCQGDQGGHGDGHRLGEPPAQTERRDRQGNGGVLIEPHRPAQQNRQSAQYRPRKEPQVRVTHERYCPASTPAVGAGTRNSRSPA